MGMASHFKTIAYTDTSPVFSRSLRRRDAWTNGDMHAIRRLPHQLFEGVGACTFLHSNRLSSCCRRGKYPHSTEPVPVVHNFLRIHFTTREVPAVALSVLERRLSVREVFH